MSEVLGGLYSLGNRVKRQLKDLVANPVLYAEQTADEIRRRMRDEPEKVVIDAWNANPLGALAGVIKQKGGNWLTGSVKDALRGLKLSDTRPDLESAINQWIEGPLTKYVKTRMASPEDEVRKLAEQGVLHTIDLPDVRPRELEILKNIREKAGFPRESSSRWEDVADYHAWPTQADAVRRGWYKDPAEARRITAASSDWLEKSAIDTPIYGYTSSMRSMAYDLGFPHLIDELHNALNPASGLPRHLQLTPEAMKNMSMEKAVRRVADINAWRAAQKIETNRRLAEQAAIVREYAENNPRGLRWVELKAADRWPEGADTQQMLAEHGDLGRYSRKQLADQLKYEGDMMGHCVGGYCDDVLSGRSRIFSLRDVKGEPHVTVEVGQQPRNVGQQDIPDRYLDEAMERLGIDTPEGQWGREGEIDRLAGDLWRKDNPNVNRIVQIKGKQNRAPNEEYLPFVQDFVRNSPLGSQWSEVGDLKNIGLHKLPDKRFITNEQLSEALQRIDPEGLVAKDPQWLLNQLNRDPKWWENVKGAFEGFAQGGLVEQNHWPFTTHLNSTRI